MCISLTTLTKAGPSTGIHLRRLLVQDQYFIKPCWSEWIILWFNFEGFKSLKHILPWLWRLNIMSSNDHFCSYVSYLFSQYFICNAGHSPQKSRSMSGRPSRLLGMLKDLRKTYRLVTQKEKLVGEDEFGNKYFEKPAGGFPHSLWFTPCDCSVESSLNRGSYAAEDIEILDTFVSRVQNFPSIRYCDWNMCLKQCRAFTSWLHPFIDYLLNAQILRNLLASLNLHALKIHTSHCSWELKNSFASNEVLMVLESIHQC